MSSAAQVTANRANAQLSTGPATDAGLAAIAHNNFRHGLASTFVVLPTEDRPAYDDLLVNLNLEFSPSTETEEILVTKMAQHHWLAQRAMRLQQPFLATALETGACSGASQLSLYLRYESSHDRAYHQALGQLLRLRAGRHRSEIGFESLKRRNELHQAQLAAMAARVETARARQQEALRAGERKEELHQAKLRKAEANASYAEFEDYLKQTMEAPLPGHGRVDFEQVYKVMRTAVDMAYLEQRKNEQAA